MMKKTDEKPLFTAEDIEITPYDTADYLDSDEMIVGYLALCLEDPDPDLFLSALGDAMRAKGISNVAEVTGLAREGLYRTCKAGKKPQFETVLKIMRALGLTLVPTLATAPHGAEKAKAPKPPRRRTAKSSKKRETTTA